MRAHWTAVHWSSIVEVILESEIHRVAQPFQISSPSHMSMPTSPQWHILLWLVWKRHPNKLVGTAKLAWTKQNHRHHQHETQTTLSLNSVYFVYSQLLWLKTMFACQPSLCWIPASEMEQWKQESGYCLPCGVVNSLSCVIVSEFEARSLQYKHTGEICFGLNNHKT